MKYQIKLIRRIVLFLLVLFVTSFLVTLSLLMVVLPSIIKSMQTLGKLDLTPLGRSIFDVFFYFLFATGGFLFFFLLILIIYSYTLNNSNVNLPPNMINPTTQTVLSPAMVSPIMRPTMMVRTIDNTYAQPAPASSVISLPRPPVFKYKPTVNVSRQRVSPPPRAQFRTPPPPPRPITPVNRPAPPLPPIQRVTRPLTTGLQVDARSPSNSSRPIGNPSRPPENSRPSGNPSRPPENSRPSGNPSRPPENSRPPGSSSRPPENSRPMNQGPNRQVPISVPSKPGMNRSAQPTSRPMNQGLNNKPTGPTRPSGATSNIPKQPINK